MDADGNPVLEPDPRYFQCRPSVTDYNPSVTFFNNLGPNNKDLRDLFAKNLAAYLERERPLQPRPRRGGRARRTRSRPPPPASIPTSPRTTRRSRPDGWRTCAGLPSHGFSSW